MFVESVPGLEVTLVSNGRELLEYEEEIDEDVPLQGSRFVEAASGATFVVHVDATRARQPSRQDSMAAYVRLDGKEMIGRYCDTKNSPDGRRNVVDIDGMDENTAYGRVLRPFQFSSLETSKWWPGLR